MHQEGLTGGRPFGPLRGIRLAGIEVAINEVRNDFDGPPDVEFLEGLLQELLRDGGDAVALFDGKLGNRQVGAVATDQRDVRAVKCSNERQAARDGHRARKQGADRVRDGVVDVEQVQRFGFEYLEHFGGESQGVGRVVEERVGSDFDFVEENMRVVQVHADGWGVADEMNVVAASG